MLDACTSDWSFRAHRSEILLHDGLPCTVYMPIVDDFMMHINMAQLFLPRGYYDDA
jgi:hypothetical protein